MEAADRPDTRRTLVPLLIAALLIPAALGSSATIFNDGDVGWHIATGQWILDHCAIPHIDPFSFTWGGKPWVPIEWLAEVMMAGAYRAAGYSGIAALVTAVLIGLHGLVFFNAARFIRPWVALGVIVAMDAALIPMMLARPHLVAWTLVALWTWLMLRAREQDRVPSLAAVLLMVPWANLHGSFVLGLVIAGAFGLEAFVAGADRPKALRQWLVFGLACLAAVFINANGIDGVIHPLRIANLEMLPLIDEWKPSNPSVTPFFFGVLAITALLILRRPPRLHWVRWLLLAFLLGMALLQMRHQAVLAIIAAMLLPPGFAQGERKAQLTSAAAPPLIAAAGLAFVALRAALPITLPYNSANPWTLIAAVPHPLRSQPVLNGYGMGGPLILSGIRPYIDGRGDMYGDELVVGYRSIIDGDARALDGAVKRWAIRWAILPNRYTKLIALLDRSPEWRRIHRDQVGVIYVRSSAS